MDLTIDKAVAYHRQLWDWLSKNPDKKKKDWPGWELIKRDYPEAYATTSIQSVRCFACLVTCEMMNNSCYLCILEWPGHDCEEMELNKDLDGLFSLWVRAYGNPFICSYIATQIRDLPVRCPAETWNPLEAWRDA